MYNFILIMLMQILIYLVFANNMASNEDDQGKDNDSKLVGGTNAYLGQFPYQVSLRMLNLNHHFCGGAIYSTRWIITAAHCLDATPDNNIVAVVGTLQRIGEGSSYDVESVVRHSGWNEKEVENDIGLVKTVKPIIFTAYVYPIEVGRNYVGQVYAILSGFGWTSENGPPATVLQYISIQTVTNDYCKQQYLKSAYSNRIYDHVLCTYQKVGTGFCNGDSGGPLVANGKLIGIVSWVPGCGNGYPDVYMRVSYFSDWISKNAV